MKTFTVGLLQLMPAGSDMKRNLVIGDEACRRAAESNADIALFPEMWSNSYQAGPGGDPEAWHAQAVTRDGPFVSHFRKLARELDMAIAITYLESWTGAPRNTVSIIDRHGEIILTYAKVHTCDFSDEAALTPGDAFYVAELDTRNGPVQVGAMICFDREFPESARILMLKGAEIVLVPNACTMDELRKAELRTRAFENMIGVAMTNYPAPQNNGRSVAFHCMAWDASGGSVDTLMIESGETEGIYTAVFDLDQLREFRRTETQGNTYRKVHAYDTLTSLEVAEPFVRADARQSVGDTAQGLELS